MKEVLILGHKGMLGNAVVKYFNKFYKIHTTDYRYPSQEFKNIITDFKGSYIINCIGAIPQKIQEFDVNYELPLFLENNTNCRVIHPSTDCESDNTPYGISKFKATDWLLKNSINTKIIKTSIIGIENNSSYGLLGWTLSQKGKIKGYTDAKWNGITTLEWAKKCQDLIENWDNNSMITTYNTNCISKYELLNIIKEIYKLDIDIEKIEGIGKDKCLKGTSVSNIKEQLIELKEFYDK
jgi:dTDP-4-dehydrorhamnose reductase